jgi:hypothetical protein
MDFLVLVLMSTRERTSLALRLLLDLNYLPANFVTLGIPIRSDQLVITGY